MPNSAALTSSVDNACILNAKHDGYFALLVEASPFQLQRQTRLDLGSNLLGLLVGQRLRVQDEVRGPG
jgi:hypothetical protein